MYLISLQLIDGQAFNVVMERICENIVLLVRLSTRVSYGKEISLSIRWIDAHLMRTPKNFQNCGNADFLEFVAMLVR
jgi:hypothetical protein